MQYYLGSCDYKWTHKDTPAEIIWVRRQLGDQLFLECNQPGFRLYYTHSSSAQLPGDIYCSCRIYVEIDSSKQATMFALRGHPQTDS
mgnify:FL=1|jgi:hypothetical protein